MPATDPRFAEAVQKVAELQRALAAEQWEFTKRKFELGFPPPIGLPSPPAMPAIELFPVASVNKTDSVNHRNWPQGLAAALVARRRDDAAHEGRCCQHPSRARR
jgi:hypothetical protein